MRFPAEITSGCIWVAIPVDWVILCLWCGRTVGRSVYGHLITKFSRMDRFSWLWGSAHASRARGASLLMGASLLALAKSIYYRLNTQEDNSSEETQQALQPCHINQPIIDHMLLNVRFTVLLKITRQSMYRNQTRNKGAFLWQLATDCITIFRWYDF